MKTFLILFFVILAGCFGLQILGFLRQQVEERTRPYHERKAQGLH